MTIYEIDNAITALIDPESGELLNYEAFEALQMERERKIEGIALWVKELNAEADAIKKEEETLAKRRKACENKASSLKGYLGLLLHGEKFKTPRVSISYRTTPSVDVDEDFVAIAEGDPNLERFLDYKDPTVRKKELSDALKNGFETPYARLVYNTSIQMR